MDWVEFRTMAGLRVVLAAAALIITVIDPAEPSRFVTATYAVLSLYLAYAVVVYATALRKLLMPGGLQYALPWIDVAVYVTLIGMSGGSNSIYFILFIFPLLGAAFRWGFRAGLAIALVSVVLFVVVGLVAAPDDSSFSLGRFLLRASSLPVLGYLIAYLGGYELRLRKRLELLRDLAALSSPRTNANRALTSALERLRDFYRADSCVMVLHPREGHAWEVRRIGRIGSGERDMAGTPEAIPASLAQTLLGFGDDELVFYRAADRIRRESVAVDGDRCREVAELIGRSAFLSVPLRLGLRSMGRLFIAADRPQFDHEDGEFLLQAVDQLMSAIDYIDMVDRMTTRAADDERQRIALDIHDRVLQPYIGVQFAAAALHRLATGSSPDPVPPQVTHGIEKLLHLTGEAIGNLRQYAQALRASGSRRGFAESLHRFAELFEAATGIAVTVRIAEYVEMDDHLAAELFSMAAEAVSNVRRHTAASRVEIEVFTTEDRLLMRVENPITGAPPAQFVPRSVTERAKSLRGSVRVEITGKTTAVIVQLPLVGQAPAVAEVVDARRALRRSDRAVQGARIRDVARRDS